LTKRLRERVAFNTEGDERHDILILTLSDDDPTQAPDAWSTPDGARLSERYDP
jgi:hypothetical protein